MIGASTVESALEAVLAQNIDARLLRCKKTIVAAESGHLKTTHRLGQALRRVLRSVTDDPKAAPSHREQAADLYQRQRKFDPRVLDRKAEQEKEEDAVDPSRREYDPKENLQNAIEKSRAESKSIQDGYQKDSVDLPAAIARVRDRFKTPPKCDDDVLAVALPDAPDEQLVQLYLSLAYWFEDLGGAYEEGKYARDLLPREAHWILNALAQASRRIVFPRPNCFCIAEEIAFRIV